MGYLTGHRVVSRPIDCVLTDFGRQDLCFYPRWGELALLVSYIHVVVMKEAVAISVRVFQ
jgi:hypothetical protein